MLKKENQAKIFFAVLVLFYLLVIFCIALIPDKYKTSEFSLVLGQAVIVIPSAVFCIVTKGDALKSIRFKKVSVGNIFILILFTYLVMPIVTFINVLSMLFVENTVASVIDGLGNNPFLLNLLMMAIMPALFEEFTFRGIIYHYSSKRSMLYGLIMSSLMFGLFHMNINQFAYALFMGVVMVLVVEATGSIWASVIVHFVVNGNSVVLQAVQKILSKMPEVEQSIQNVPVEELTPEIERMAMLTTAGLFGVIALITGAIAYFLYKWLCKRCGTLEHVKDIFKKVQKEETKREIMAQDVLANVMLILSVGVCVIIMLIIEV